MKMHWHCFQRVQSLFVFAFGSLITSFYTEKKIPFSREKSHYQNVFRGLEKHISTLCFPSSFALVIQCGLPQCFSFFLTRLLSICRHHHLILFRGSSRTT